jgi:uncharacterized protein
MRNLLVITALVVAQSAPAQNLRIGCVPVDTGLTSYGIIPVPAGSDAGTEIPIIVINGVRPGKTVALVAGSHGTEYASIVALTRLAPRIDARQLRGTVIIAPLLNIPSFEQMTVHVNPIDKKGMNANYPGDTTGTQTQRALAAFTREVVDRADVIVDLHGGDMDENLTPYSYWFRAGDAKLDSAALKLALAFGLDTIIVRDIDLSNPAHIRSLSGYSISRNKIALVAEAGRSGTTNARDIDALIDGSLNVLGALGMIDRKVHPISRPFYVDAGSRVAAQSPGMFYATVGRGARVVKNQVIGYTTDYVGRRTGVIAAPVAGVVTFIRGVPSMWNGATLVNVSQVLKTVPAWKKP